MLSVEYLTPECDNKVQCHDMISPPSYGKGGERAYCRLCNRTYYLRHNANGAPDNREFGKLYYRWIVQPDKPLYYKVHPGVMKLGHGVLD